LLSQEPFQFTQVALAASELNVRLSWSHTQ